MIASTAYDTSGKTLAFGYNTHLYAGKLEERGCTSDKRKRDTYDPTSIYL